MAGRQCGRVEGTTEGDLGAWLPEVPPLKLQGLHQRTSKLPNQADGWVQGLVQAVGSVPRIMDSGCLDSSLGFAI